MTQKDSEDDRCPGEMPVRLQPDAGEDSPRDPSAHPATAPAENLPAQDKPWLPWPEADTAESFGHTRPGLSNDPTFDLPVRTAETQPPDAYAVEPREELAETGDAQAYDASRAPTVRLDTPGESASAGHLTAEWFDDAGSAADTAADETPPVDTDTQPATLVAEQPPPTNLSPVRSAWETPPPIIDAPSRQWRDSGPETSDVSWPPVEVEHRTPEPSAVAQREAPVEQGTASSPSVPGEPLPPPELLERPEPVWQAAPVHAAFQDAPARFDARPADAPQSRWERAKDLARTGARYAAYAIGGYFALVFVLILLYRFVNPPASSLMIVQSLTGTSVNQEWVPLDDISPSLVRAVIVSEDWSFCEHYGIDIKAIEQAIERSGNGIPRGASTISMQTTKNLFLWNAKSYIRKAVELPLTLAIETVWPKHRILEIYLNVAEWGPGIFGAEAAAQYHFNKPASRLSEREAAQLAASLPNPIIREAGDPGPRTARKATVIQSRMRNAGGAAQCVLGDDR